MAFDLVSNSIIKEEWLDDMEKPSKIEEEDEEKLGTALNVDTQGESNGVVQFGTICESLKEEVDFEQVEPKGELLSYKVKLDTDALGESTLDPLGEEMPYFCHVCDFAANSSGALLSHVKCHENENGNPGGHVHYGYDVNSTSTQTKWHTARKTHACDHCDFTSTILRDMIKHKKIHLPPFSCSECDFKTTSKKSLESHNKIHFPDGRFYCGICRYRTRNRECLQNHMMNHARKLCPTTEGPADPRFLGLKCRQCDHVATSITDLIKHVDSHRVTAAALGEAASNVPKNIKKYNVPSGLKCDQCNFEGTSERGLIAHYSFQHKNVSCEYCPLACADRKELKQHIVDVHNAKPSQLVLLNKESCKATKKGVFCNLCGYKGVSQWLLYKHMKKIHNAFIMQPRKRTKIRSPPKLLMLTGTGLLD